MVGNVDNVDATMRRCRHEDYDAGMTMMSTATIDSDEVDHSHSLSAGSPQRSEYIHTLSECDEVDHSHSLSSKRFTRPGALPDGRLKRFELSSLSASAARNKVACRAADDDTTRTKRMTMMTTDDVDDRRFEDVNSDVDDDGDDNGDKDDDLGYAYVDFGDASKAEKLCSMEKAYLFGSQGCLDIIVPLSSSLSSSSASLTLPSSSSSVSPRTDIYFVVPVA